VTFPNELTNPAPANWPARVNEGFKSMRGAALYAPNDLTTTGLTQGFFGGWLDASTNVSDGTVALTDDATNYIVAHKTTGAVTDATSTTNWNDSTTYGRVAIAITVDGAITVYKDWRLRDGGILTGAAGSGAATSQPGEMISGFIGTVSDKDYRIVVKAAHGGTITETTTRSESGTATFTFKVNTTALGGTANSVSSSEQSQAHSGTNTFAADDDLVITASSNSSCLGASFTIKYTRTLA
jgi:hypothetical protein